jgi:hypothetical protein
MLASSEFDPADMEVLNPLIALPRTNITARYKRLAAHEFDVRRFGSKEGGYTFEMIYGQYYRAAAPAESMIEIAVLALRRLHTESGEICD